MHILRKIDAPEDKYLTVFMGYGREDNHLAVELTYSELTIIFIIISREVELKH